MSTPVAQRDHPDPEALADTFHVYEVEVADGTVRYYGEPLTPQERVVKRLAPLFRDRGYRVSLNYDTGEHVLIAEERSVGIDGIPWLNVALFVATVATTLTLGAQWYGIPLGELVAEPWRVLEAWPFTLAVLGILGIHEFGHYALSRHHDVQASLPYFLPVPTLIGTAGAIIRMKDHLPSRRALFDIGVSGPLAGLAATVVVTAIGVSLPPIEVTGASLFSRYELGYPPLIQGIAFVLGEPLSYADPSLAVNPVVIGAWVGSFITFLNLLPVGQLDGAHVLRSLIGERFDAVQVWVPGAMFGLAAALYLFGDARAIGIWLFWGLFTLVLSRAGSVDPIDDSDVGRRRKAVGVLTLVLGLLCFTPVPIITTL